MSLNNLCGDSLDLIAKYTKIGAVLSALMFVSAFACIIIVIISPMLFPSANPDEPGTVLYFIKDFFPIIAMVSIVFFPLPLAAGFVIDQVKKKQ